MPNAPPPVPSRLRVLLWLVVLWIVATPAFPADTIYKYVDDEGVPHFTDQWQLIPETYRSRIQELDPSTGKPFKPEPPKAAPSLPQGSSRVIGAAGPQTAPAAHVEPPFYAAWLETFSRLSIPLPSQIQLGVGLMSVVVILGALKIMRVSPNPLVQLMLKGAIVTVLAGGAYAMYVAGENGRIPRATRDSTPQSISGKELIRNIQGTTEKAKDIITETTRAPLEKVKEATIGDAIRSRDLMNQSNLDKEKALKKIESKP